MRFYETVQIGDCTLYHGDCLEILPTLGNVDAVITSPPYGNMRDYGGHKPNITAVIGECGRLLNIGGVIVWNETDQVIDGSESGDSFRHALYAKDVAGLRLHDTMIYCKEGVTFPDNNRYHPCHEYMFVFSKGAPANFNGIKDWANKWRGTPMHGTDRQKDGSTTKIHGDGNLVPNYGLRRNWWPISNAYKGETDGHPAPMPYSMAHDHIVTWTMPRQLVCDPFMGSGTAGIASLKSGRRFIGIEIEPKYFDISCRRIEDANKQGDFLCT